MFNVSWALDLRKTMALEMSPWVLIGGSFPLERVSYISMYLFHFSLFEGESGEEVIRELFICRRMELWSEEN